MYRVMGFPLNVGARDSERISAAFAQVAVRQMVRTGGAACAALQDGRTVAGVNAWETTMAACIVIVQIDLPKVTEEQGIARGLASAPQYRDLGAKGLIRKDYLNGDAGLGGVYLWDSRASAEAWFTEATMQMLEKRFGVRPKLTWYDTYVTVDNLTDETRVNGKAMANAA
jgi:hypothetical protein